MSEHFFALNVSQRERVGDDKDKEYDVLCEAKSLVTKRQNTLLST